MPCSLQQNLTPLHVLPFHHSGRFSMAADDWWLTLLALDHAHNRTRGARRISESRVKRPMLNASAVLEFTQKDVISWPRPQYYIVPVLDFEVI